MPVAGAGVMTLRSRISPEIIGYRIVRVSSNGRGRFFRGPGMGGRGRCRGGGSVLRDPLPRALEVRHVRLRAPPRRVPEVRVVEGGPPGRGPAREDQDLNRGP